MEYQARLRFAELVKELRGEKSYRGFGQKIGVVGNTVKEWEDCLKNPSFTNQKKIADLSGFRSFDEFENYLYGGAKAKTESEYRLAETIRNIREMSFKEVTTVLGCASEQIAKVAEESGTYKV